MRSLLVAAALIAIPAVALSQSPKPKRDCTGSPPDSGMTHVTPIYRDCDVDTPAKLKNTPARPEISAVSGDLRAGCQRAEFEIVVDTSGLVEPLILRASAENTRDFADAVKATFSTFRYSPAILDGKPVRQVVVYKTSAEIRREVVVVQRGSGPPPGPAGRLSLSSRC